MTRFARKSLSSESSVDLRGSRASAATAVLPGAAASSVGVEGTAKVGLIGLLPSGEWQLEQLEGQLDRATGALWLFMKPRARPSFTPELLRDLNAVGDSVESAFNNPAAKDNPPLRFIVLGSRVPGIYNLGGDLSLFQRLIEAQDREGLRRYAHACVRSQYRVYCGLNAPICMVALVQGDALGGGFEAALANDVIIAERKARFGLPEVLFNLFPGMGAYSFLSRRIGAVQAERMILSGKVYTAEELYELGVVDMVVDDGCGEAGVADFITTFERTRIARRAVLETRKIVNPVSYQELIDVTDVWVDAALQLSAADLRRMSHLAKAQERRWSKILATQ